MSKSAIMSVEFHGTTLSLINRDGKPYVALKPICEALTIDHQAQPAPAGGAWADMDDDSIPF